MTGVPLSCDAIMMMIDCAALVTRFHAAQPGNFGNAAEARRASDLFRIVHQSRNRACGCVAKQRDDRAWFPRTKI
ncbi:hypothetical protein ACVIIV_007318 [Bradyrhizobium sp. USDA 4354]